MKQKKPIKNSQRNKNRRSVGQTTIIVITEKLNGNQKLIRRELLAAVKAFDESQKSNREIVGWRPVYELKPTKPTKTKKGN